MKYAYTIRKVYNIHYICFWKFLQWCVKNALELKLQVGFGKFFWLLQIVIFKQHSHISPTLVI